MNFICTDLTVEEATEELQGFLSSETIWRSTLRQQVSSETLGQPDHRFNIEATRLCNIIFGALKHMWQKRDKYKQISSWQKGFCFSFYFQK